MQRAMTNTTKAATDYLAASGATAICVIQSEGGCTFRSGTKIDQSALSIYWLREEQAADQNANRAALSRHRCHVVLGAARLRSDQHAQG
jgi:hypothetical protein